MSILLGQLCLEYCCFQQLICGSLIFLLVVVYSFDISGHAVWHERLRLNEPNSIYLNGLGNTECSHLCFTTFGSTELKVHQSQHQTTFRFSYDSFLYLIVVYMCHKIYIITSTTTGNIYLFWQTFKFSITIC